MMNNHQEILEQLLGIDLKVDFTLFKKIQFNDWRLEDKFISNSQKRERMQKIISDVILLRGYLMNLLYIIVYNRRYLFFISFLLFFFTSILIWIVSYNVKSNRIKAILDHIQIFLFSLNINSKAIIIAIEFSSESYQMLAKQEYVLVAQLIRLIIYDFIVTKLLLTFKLDGKIVTHLSYSLFNLTTIIFCQIKLNSKYFIYLDGIVGIIYSIIFYFFQKLWEYNIRLVFAEKYKFQNLFLYTNDFILGLNGYHLNFKNNHLVCYDEKFFKFINENLKLKKMENCEKDLMKNKNLFTKQCLAATINQKKIF
jgi:hypothetical protein